MGKNRRMRKMRIYGDPILKQKALPVGEIDQKIRDFGDALIDMMIEHDGAGLAATQIGKKIRMMALCIPFPSKNRPPIGFSPGEMLLIPRMPMVFVNPEILGLSQFVSVKEEGCLSVPKIYAPVSRPVSVIFKAQILDGENIECECGGLLARAIQHEIDHLDGIVFVDRLSDEELEKIRPELEKIKSGKPGAK